MVVESRWVNGRTISEIRFNYVQIVKDNAVKRTEFDNGSSE